MQKLTEQLETLAMQPRWEEFSDSNLALLSNVSDEEQALLKEKIICYVLTPEPETPETPEPGDTPEPEQPEQPEQQPTSIINAAA